MAFALVIALFLLWITMNGELPKYVGFATTTATPAKTGTP